MPRISELVEATAKATGLSSTLVGLYARRLIDSGILPKGRGSRSAWAEPKQAAALLIALWATDRPANGPTKVRMFSQHALDRLTEILEWAADLDVEIWHVLWWGCEIHFEREPQEIITVQWDAKLVKFYGQQDLIAAHVREEHPGGEVELKTEFFYPHGHYLAVPKASKRAIRVIMPGEIFCELGAFFAGVDFETYSLRHRSRPEGLDLDQRSLVTPLVSISEET